MCSATPLLVLNLGPQHPDGMPLAQAQSWSTPWFVYVYVGVYVCGVCVWGVAELAPHDIWACGVEQEEETMVLVVAAGALGAEQLLHAGAKVFEAASSTTNGYCRRVKEVSRVDTWLRWGEEQVVLQLGHGVFILIATTQRWRQTKHALVENEQATDAAEAAEGARTEYKKPSSY